MSRVARHTVARAFTALAFIAGCSSGSAPADAKLTGAGLDASVLDGSGLDAGAGDGACPARLPASGAPCALPSRITCAYAYCDEGGPGRATCSGSAWQVFVSKAPCTVREAGGTFACGTSTCGPNQYCSTVVGGACVPTDAGCQASQSTTCANLPPGCSNCACLGDSNSCGECTETSGHVAITCYAP